MDSIEKLPGSADPENGIAKGSERSADGHHGKASQNEEKRKKNTVGDLSHHCHQWAIQPE
jgi:hypothetical protein